MNKFKKLKKVKQHYQQQFGLEKYQQELEKVSRDIQPPVIKEEEAPETKISASKEVQTDALKVQLSDLSNGELMRLMALLNQYHKSQMPFWMTQPMDLHLPLPPLPPRYPL